MLITGARIRSLRRHLAGVPEGAPVVVGLREPDRFAQRLQQVGFSSELAVGETVLPAIIGPRTKFNAEGDYIIHRDRPKETAYRQTVWTWFEFRGPYDREEVSKVVDVPYERYPRTFRPPPSVQIQVAVRAESKYLVTEAVPHDEAHAADLLHRINLFLELFGEAETLTADLDGYIVAEVRRLNWTVLPPGEHPWPRLQKQLQPIVDQAAEGNRPLLLHRLSFINAYKPTFTAVGRAGFAGYIVFGFPEKDLFVLESLYYGNATYVFGEQWEALSRMTKAEILGGHLERDRIIHRDGWQRAVRALLS